MKRDTTRDTFEPRRHFSSVRQQQGRVQLDSEWNEQADIVGHRIETETVDVVGPCGVPCDGAGFEVEPTPDTGSDLILTPGRAYVDGILCQLDPPELPIVRFLAGGTRLRLVPGSLVDARVEVGDWVEVSSDRNRETGTRGPWTQVTAVDRANHEIRVADDVSVVAPFPNPTVQRLPTYSAQPDRPEPVALPASPAEDGTYLAYLDVWRRHVGALEEPSIREVALGGPDTATREQVLCQVRLLLWEGDDVDEPPHCLDRPQLWRDTIAASTGRLRAFTQPVPPAPDPCEVPPGGGYTRLENQHYRVEIHTGGERDDVELKWSRDNGSMVTAWTDQDPADPDKLTVESIGRDAVQALAPGQWIELSDDDRELEGRAGLMVEILDVDDRVLTIDSHGQVVDFATFGDRPKVRRWDMPSGLISGGAGPIDLEGGIQIELQVGEYHVGDYWRIPARAYIGERLGDIEWPRDTNGEALSKLPDGVEHHYCKLALVELAGGVFTKLSDCRTEFPPLTRQVQLDMAGGDGQEAMPGDTLPCPLSVVVRNGGRPVAGRRVRFEVGGADGELSELLAGPGVSPTLEVGTNDAGTASVFWTLPAAIPAVRPCFRVRAFLLDAAGDPIEPPIDFHASQSIARQVQFEPSACAGLLREPNVSTVQEGLDALWCNASLTMIGGQGQQGAPGERLPCALRVAVRNGRWPVAGQRVRFGFVHERVDGDVIDEDNQNGILEPRDPNEGEGEAVIFADDNRILTTSGELGVTACYWTLPEEIEVPRRCLRVWAHLVDDDERQIGPYVVFNADQVVPTEQQPQDVTLLEEILRSPDGNALLNDDTFDLDLFAPRDGDAGLTFLFDRDLDDQSINDPWRERPIYAPRPSVVVEVFTPRFLVGDNGRLVDADLADPGADFMDLNIAGYTSLVLNATVEAANNRIRWIPTETARSYLEVLLAQLQNLQIDRLLVQLTLEGNFVWGGLKPPIHVDAEAFGGFGSRVTDPDPLNRSRISWARPSGDGRPGGQFQGWFWLTRGSAGPSGLDLVAIGGIRIVTGALRDPDGNGIPAATITMNPTGVGGGSTRTALTNASGQFRFANVSPGNYRVTAQVVGFLPADRPVNVVGTIGDFDTPGLVAVDGIGRATADRLEGVGIRTLDDLVAADAAELAIRLGFNTDRVSRFIEHARRILDGA